MLYYGYSAALCMELYVSRVENNKTQKNTSHRYSRIELKSCTNSDISIHWQCYMVQWKLTMAATLTKKPSLLTTPNNDGTGTRGRNKIPHWMMISISSHFIQSIQFIYLLACFAHKFVRINYAFKCVFLFVLFLFSPSNVRLCHTVLPSNSYIPHHHHQQHHCTCTIFYSNA